MFTHPAGERVHNSMAGPLWGQVEQISWDRKEICLHHHHHHHHHSHLQPKGTSPVAERILWVEDHLSLTHTHWSCGIWTSHYCYSQTWIPPWVRSEARALLVFQQSRGGGLPWTSQSVTKEFSAYSGQWLWDFKVYGNYVTAHFVIPGPFFCSY